MGHVRAPPAQTAASAQRQGLVMQQVAVPAIRAGWRWQQQAPGGRGIAQQQLCGTRGH